MKICKKNKKSRQELYKAYVDKQNKNQKSAFAKVPFGNRLVFAPHCMRNSAVCRAQEKDFYFICKDCGGCTIYKINRLIKELGYGGLYVLKGGRAILKIAAEKKPQAIVGISCYFEGEQGFKVMKETDIIAQYVPLIKDGCHDTDADISEIEKILKQKE
ncbi:MAG: DUF116 domain-containing protein [Endomicrobium sp.]|jgi:hypothetical protein|nr:DUF116 domain-containing protein [Endomicrobium sp.]